MVDTSPTFPNSILIATLGLNHMAIEEWVPVPPGTMDSLITCCSSTVVTEVQRLEEVWKLFSYSTNFTAQSRSIWLGNIPTTRNSTALAHAWRRAIYTSILKFSNSKQLAMRTVLYALLNADTKTAFAKRGNPVKLGCKFGPNLA